MLKASLAFLRAHLGRVVDQVDQRADRVVIERHGRPVAAIVPYRDYEALMDVSLNSPDYLAWKQGQKLGRFKELYAAMKRAEAAHPIPKAQATGDGTMVRNEWAAKTAQGQ